MRVFLSARLRDDMTQFVDDALDGSGIVNVSYIAETIRLRNIQENVALEDIAAAILHYAKSRNAPMEFDISSSSH